MLHTHVLQKSTACVKQRAEFGCMRVLDSPLTQTSHHLQCLIFIYEMEQDYLSLCPSSVA